MELNNLQYGFGRAADPRLVAVKDDRALDQPGVAAHGFEQLLVGKPGIVQPQLSIFRLARAQQIAWLNAEQPDNVSEFGHAWRLLEILDRVRLEAAFAQQSEGSPAFGTLRIMVNGQRHWQ